MKLKQVTEIINNASVGVLALHKNKLLIATRGDQALLGFVADSLDVLDIASDIALIASDMLQLFSDMGSDEITVDGNDKCQLCGRTDTHTHVYGPEGVIVVERVDLAKYKHEFDYNENDTTSGSVSDNLSRCKVCGKEKGDPIHDE